MPRRGRNASWLLGGVMIGVFVCVSAVVVVATTGSLWALIVAVGVLLLATLAVVGDVEWILGDSGGGDASAGALIELVRARWRSSSLGYLRPAPSTCSRPRSPAMA